MITVTFDSNVWEEIVDETKRSKKLIYQLIFNHIKEKKIEPFFFEGLAVHENILKNNRKDFIGNFKATIIIEIENDKPDITEGSPAPVLIEYLKENIPKALELGFKFIWTPRIGSPCLNISNQYKAPDKKHSQNVRLERTFECAKFIESLGAGKANLHNKLDSCGKRGIVTQTKEDKSLNKKQYGNGVAEWVDGDAIAGSCIK
ncbi:hypothetical protein [Xenorhabdus bovienii]|uniref:hypothetical protein n=1 Tax=Xenorhabdus bovienii TaxID=40576 RepID=UPI0023B32465|nr:hypothetical protein [Xenorhabdus bovienii]MDE9545505.1 hypothetical protein [Xenorhabdus bovienii]